MYVLYRMPWIWSIDVHWVESGRRVAVWTAHSITAVWMFSFERLHDPEWGRKIRNVDENLRVRKQSWTWKMDQKMPYWKPDKLNLDINLTVHLEKLKNANLRIWTLKQTFLSLWKSYQASKLSWSRYSPGYSVAGQCCLHEDSKIISLIWLDGELWSGDVCYMNSSIQICWIDSAKLLRGNDSPGLFQKKTD